MTATDKRILLAIVSLCLASTAIGRTGPKVRWGRQLVTPTRDHIRGAMVADSNDGIYMVVTRESEDNSGSKAKAVFLLKYSRQGDQLWSRQLDAGVEGTSGLTADDQGNIYVFGHATSTPERKTKGGFDACIAKYDHTGTRLWSRQLGTPRHDVCSGLAVGDSGVLYISGYTYGSFAKPNKGGADMFIAAYGQSGTLIWTQEFREFNSRGGTCGRAVAIDSDNNCYHAGQTNADLFGLNNGTPNVYIVRFDEARDEQASPSP